MKIHGELNDETIDRLLNYSDALTEALTEMERAGNDYANAIDAYERIKSRNLHRGIGKNAEERLSSIYELIRTESLAMDTAKYYKEFVTEKVKSLRQQVSALQTVVAARREEASAVGYRQVQMT